MNDISPGPLPQSPSHDRIQLPAQTFTSSGFPGVKKLTEKISHFSSSFSLRLESPLVNTLNRTAHEDFKMNTLRNGGHCIFENGTSSRNSNFSCNSLLITQKSNPSRKEEIDVDNHSPKKSFVNENESCNGNVILAAANRNFLNENLRNSLIPADASCTGRTSLSTDLEITKDLRSDRLRSPFGIHSSFSRLSLNLLDQRLPSSCSDVRRNSFPLLSNVTSLNSTGRHLTAFGCTELRWPNSPAQCSSDAVQTGVESTFLTLTLTKSELDGADRDVQHKVFAENFKVTEICIGFTVRKLRHIFMSCLCLQIEAQVTILFHIRCDCWCSHREAEPPPILAGTGCEIC